MKTIRITSFFFNKSEKLKQLSLELIALLLLIMGRFTAGLAAIFLIWPTITEQLHRSRNVHYNVDTDCPTAKTGLMGGGAFLSLNASLFWLLSLVLVSNAREDYFEDSRPI